MTPTELERARRTLIRRDPALGALIRRVGACHLTAGMDDDPFTSLARTIASQQLSTKAADTIFSRVAALAGGRGTMTCERILSLDPTALRAAGLSGSKVAFLRDLAERTRDGRLDLRTLHTRSDDEVADMLMAVKGLGRWSADMFLMFKLARPDILPIGDLGIVKGLQKLWGMKATPKPVTMIRRAEIWRPYRSVASWYVWRIHEDA